MPQKIVYLIIYEACADRVLANSGPSIYFFAQWQRYLLVFPNKEISLLQESSSLRLFNPKKILYGNFDRAAMKTLSQDGEPYRNQLRSFI